MKHALITQEEVSTRVASFVIRCVMAIALVAVIVSAAAVPK